MFNVKIQLDLYTCKLDVFKKISLGVIKFNQCYQIFNNGYYSSTSKILIDKPKRKYIAKSITKGGHNSSNDKRVHLFDNQTQQSYTVTVAPRRLHVQNITRSGDEKLVSYF